MRWDAFISYKSEDRPWAEALQQHLAQRKLSVFYDYQSLRAGAEWQPQLEQALADSAALLVLWSKKAASQDTMSWTEEERYLFRMEEVRRPQARVRPVIMVLLDAEPAAQAALHHVADLRDGKFYEGQPSLVPAATWSGVVDKVTSSIAEGQRLMARRRWRRRLTYGSVVVAVASVGLIAARTPPTFTSCVRSSLVRARKLDEPNASSVAMKLQELISAAAAGNPPVLTSETRARPEYLLLSDGAQRALIGQCTQDFNLRLPTPSLRSTVDAFSDCSRPIVGAKIYGEGADEGSSCTTSGSGACTLSLPFAEGNKLRLVASRDGYASAVKELSVDAFLGRPKLILSRVSHSVSIAVKRNLKNVENATVTFMGSPDNEVWSAECEASHGCGTGCRTTTTDWKGVALFHYSKPFVDASFEVTIKHERRRFGINSNPMVKPSYTLEWDHPCHIDGDQPPRAWTGASCRDPKVVDLTNDYKVRFPNELGVCTSVLVYKCP